LDAARAAAGTRQEPVIGALDRVRLGPRALTVPVGNLAAVGWKRS